MDIVKKPSRVYNDENLQSPIETGLKAKDIQKANHLPFPVSNSVKKASKRKQTVPVTQEDEEVAPEAVQKVVTRLSLQDPNQQAKIKPNMKETEMIAAKDE